MPEDEYLWLPREDVLAYEEPRGFSMVVGVETTDEADRVFAGLADGGEVLMPLQTTAWSLLVVVSIVLVATIKAREGQLYGSANERTVLRAYDAPPELTGSPSGTESVPVS